MKAKRTTTVQSCQRLAEGVYDLRLVYETDPGEVLPGQFVGVYSKDSARRLPRPISIAGYDPKGKVLRLVFRVVGAGTEEFSHLKAGDQVDVLGILGNGYDLPALSGKKVLLLGGGIGAPPMLCLAKALHSLPGTEVIAVLGYRTNDLFLADEFEEVSKVVIATDDGTAGFHGNVVEAVRAQNLPADVICACGPLPMLRGVKALSEERQVPRFLSLEERMACGVGACLGCVTKTTKVDAHSHVKNARICTEGPVFNAEDVEI